MKKPKDVDDLAARLSGAAAAPLVPAPEARDLPEKHKAAPRRGSVSVFLRLPRDLHARMEAEAVKRTKNTGRGVTVQQVILEKLAGAA